MAETRTPPGLCLEPHCAPAPPPPLRGGGTPGAPHSEPQGPEFCAQASGHVPLQVSRFEVDALNCLVVKPHRLLTRGGGEMNSDELQELYDGLKLNKVNQMTICSQLHESRALPGQGGGHRVELKHQNSRLVCTCDPEMGQKWNREGPCTTVRISVLFTQRSPASCRHHHSTKLRLSCWVG